MKVDWRRIERKKERHGSFFPRVLFQLDIGRVTFQTERICERGKSVLCTGL